MIRLEVREAQAEERARAARQDLGQEKMRMRVTERLQYEPDNRLQVTAATVTLDSAGRGWGRSCGMSYWPNETVTQSDHWDPAAGVLKYLLCCCEQRV